DVGHVGLERGGATGGAGHIHKDGGAVVVEVEQHMQRVGQLVTDLGLNGLAATVVAQANLVGHRAGKVYGILSAQHALLQDQLPILAGRRRSLEDVFGFAKTIATRRSAGVRTAAIGIVVAARLHGARLAQRKAHPVGLPRRAVEHALGVDLEVEETAGGNGRHIHNIVLHNPFVARLSRAAIRRLAGRNVGPVAIAVAVEPDIQVHAVAGGRGRVGNTHRQRLLATVEELDAAVAPAVVASIVVGHVAHGAGRGVAQNVVGAVLIWAIVRFMFAG